MNNLHESLFGMGFVYFNNSAALNNNSDYLEFNNSGLSDSFSPGDCSSPRGNRQKNWKWNKGKKQNRYYDTSNDRHRNNSNNSFHNNNSPRNNSGNQRNFHHEKRDGPVDISCYFHPSMIEDPWAVLVRSNQLNARSSRSETNESLSGLENDAERSETNESLSRLENDAESDSNVCSDDEDNPDTTTDISRDEC